MIYILYEEEVEIADVQGDVKCSPDHYWLWLWLSACLLDCVSLGNGFCNNALVYCSRLISHKMCQTA